MKAIGRVILFAAAMSFYLFLAGTFDAVEVTAGLVCALAATVLSGGLDAVASRRFSFAPPVKAIWRPIASLIPEMLTVGRELLLVALQGAKGEHGGFIDQPFEPGGDDPASHGRRALAILGVSLAPRTFVIRGEPDTVLLLHGFPPKPPSSDARWPI